MKKLYERLSLTLAVMLMLASVAWAQDRTVSGTITDENAVGMPGVNIIVKGLSSGTVTDVNGKFTLTAPANGTLVITFVGYKTVEVPVGDRTSIDVAMDVDLASLDEVIVTGYALENRREVTGAVSTVKTSALTAVPTGNVEQALQGRVPGVVVITNGQPGTSSTVRLRGFGSIENNEPLYVVDGVPVQNTDFLQPNDIESATVLKDAASASIYGARAAGGVIVYTTKKGKRDQGLKISYDGLVGFTDPGKVNTILNPQEQADWTWNAIKNTATQTNTAPNFTTQQYGSNPAGPVLPDYILVGPNTGVVGQIDLAAERAKYNTDPSKGDNYLVMPSNKSGTNWWDAITRTGVTTRHSLSFSGGNEKSVFNVSLGAFDQQGALLYQSLKRYSVRINSEHKIGNHVRIGENIQMTYLERNGLVGGNGGRGVANEESVYLSAFRMPAIIPIYDAFGGYSGTAAKGFNNPRNPVAERVRQKDNKGYNTSVFGNVYAEVDIINGLTLRSSIGGQFSSTSFHQYNRPSYENSENGNNFVSYQENYNEGRQYNFTNTLHYVKKVGISNFDVLVGYENLNTGFGRGITGTGQKPFSSDPGYISLSTTSSKNVDSYYDPGATFASVFGQVKYSLFDKYILTAVLRRDGSSKFGATNRYGTFPAISGAWRISDEAFMQSNRFITDMKIRGGWGQMGNSNPVTSRNNSSLYASDLGQAYYDINGGNGAPQEGFFRSNIGNPNAKWETSETTNIGVDATFLDGKIEFVADLWRKDTKDLLYRLENPAVIGPAALNPFVNIAKMRNQGIDLMIINRGNITQGLTYEVTVTGSFLKNRIVSLAPGVPYFESGGTRIGNAIRNQVGGPIASYFGYKVEGLFQNQGEVDNYIPQDGKGVGRFKYADLNGRDENGQLTGKPDGKIDVDDRTAIGSPVPKFNGGVNLVLGYKNFEMTAFLYTALGFQNYNFSRWFTDFYPSFTGAAYGKRVRDSFTFENGGNSTPIFENVSNVSTNNGQNTYYVEKGDYARLTNLMFAYKLPNAFLSKYGIERMKLYVQATNLFTITKYSGLDPGVGGAADTTLGLDFGNPPAQKGFNIGVNLGF
ncbi:MAG: TonB-dependent receptor [Chryseolinea sp.]